MECYLGCVAPCSNKPERKVYSYYIAPSTYSTLIIIYIYIYMYMLNLDAPQGSTAYLPNAASCYVCLPRPTLPWRESAAEQLLGISRPKHKSWNRRGQKKWFDLEQAVTQNRSSNTIDNSCSLSPVLPPSYELHFSVKPRSVNPLTWPSKKPCQSCGSSMLVLSGCEVQGSSALIVSPGQARMGLQQVTREPRAQTTNESYIGFTLLSCPQAAKLHPTHLNQTKLLV